MSAYVGILSGDSQGKPLEELALSLCVGGLAESGHAGVG